jgi:two-component system, OmpR family, phosphate regulon sensor histidine kinase PhoR
MKKGHIRILVVVMSAALLGLLAVQWFWVRNAVALREKQFQYKVMNAMESVTQRLEDREMAIAISNAALIGLPSLQLADLRPPKMRTGPCKGDGNPNHLGQEPLRANDTTVSARIERHPHSQREYIGGQWVMSHTIETKVTLGDTEVVYRERSCQPSDQEYLDYMQGVMDRMAHSIRPIHERLRFGLLDSLIRQELLRRGVEEEFVCDVMTDAGISLVTSTQAERSPINREGEYYRAQLFPHDLAQAEYYLEVQFPERASPAIRAMGLVLPTSGILVLIVMACFGIALIAWRRQQKLSDLKSDFINNMTHELKTPISTISLALEAMGDPDMQTKERIGLYTRVIGQENERLKSQVDRVLQVAALERGELHLDMQPLDLDVVVQEQMERIRLHIESRGGKLHYVCEAMDASVVGDEMHLGGVIFNLLDNANKYSPECPHITVCLRNVAGGLELTVTDAGIGICADAQRRVFEKFYRVPTGNVHDVKGFGIGLSYAKSMAQAHGGDIKLNSEPGKGSTFKLFIPQPPTSA